MRSHITLGETLRALDGQGYKAYRTLAGAWAFEDFVLHVDHVQGDPFALPSRVRIHVSPEVAGFDASAYRTPQRALGTSCFLAHAFARAAASASRPRGTGRSGEIRMMHPGQLVIETTALRMDDAGGIEARFTAGLPANGRRIAGEHARALMLEDVPDVVGRALRATEHDTDEVERHAAAKEDATALREALSSIGLVAFVADGARLPRRSGVDDRPLTGAVVVPFRSPPSLSTTISVPNAGPISGMGIPEGVTLILGGGFHGKSTLLRALQDGVYDHPPGDGRELVVTRDDAVKIRAEDGRSVAAVDISRFIDRLPLGQETGAFSTPNASGSTSQAAAIVEALEAGAGALLIDEDTSATNFMIRDRRMQALVPVDGEPITPFVDRARELFEDHGISTILVVGGSGDYLDVADLVVRMADYQASDVTAAARIVAAEIPTGRTSEARRPFTPSPSRRIARTSLDPSRGRRSRSVKVPDDRTLLFGSESIDLAAVEQLALPGQIRTTGEALAWIVAECPADARTMAAVLDAIDFAIDTEGLDTVTTEKVGDLARARRHEIAAALNRLRSFRVE
jgi:predicted ABC-class ATPase